MVGRPTRPPRRSAAGPAPSSGTAAGRVACALPGAAARAVLPRKRWAGAMQRPCAAARSGTGSARSSGRRPPHAPPRTLRRPPAGALWWRPVHGPAAGAGGAGAALRVRCRRSHGPQPPRAVDARDQGYGTNAGAPLAAQWAAPRRCTVCASGLECGARLGLARGPKTSLLQSKTAPRCAAPVPVHRPPWTGTLERCPGRDSVARPPAGLERAAEPPVGMAGAPARRRPPATGAVARALAALLLGAAAATAAEVGCRARFG